MADLKISELGSLAGADLVAADVVAVVDNSASETKKLTVGDLIANGVTVINDATIPGAKLLFLEAADRLPTAGIADLAVTTAKIANSDVTAAKLADNSSVTLVSTLPGSGDFVGQIALDTDDSKIYVWSGSAWTSVKAAGSINVVSGSTSGLVNITATTSGDTVTISTTLDDTSAARQFLAGPTGSGGTVGYRAIIGTDLPTASSSAKGGVIVNGNGLAMSGDTLTVNNSVTAETTENHLVKYDANGLVTSGRVIASGDIPVATSSTTGGVQPGTGLSVTGSGVLNHSNSLTAATGPKITFDAQGHVTGSTALVATDIPDLDAAKLTTGSLPSARIADDAITADKLADRSTATIAEITPAGGAFIGQTHLNSITGDYFLWDGNVWQPIGISVGEIVLAGTYNATTNLVATVTTEGTAVGYTVGQALPAASSSNKGHYVIISTAGTGTSPAPTVALSPPDFLLSTGTLYTEIDVSQTVTAQQASNVQFTPTGSIAANNVQTAIAEVDTEKAPKASPTFSGTVSLDTAATIQFEGSSANDFETTLTVTDPTADRTITLPNVTGTVVTTGDTGSVTSAMIADGAIVNADINASAEIAVNKLANGTARQLLQTDAGGSGVEFTSNVDVPGTLDVTGAATLDSTLTVTGVINADGKIKFPAGTAALPSFYNGTDTDTGLYFSAANEISISTGGTQRVVVDASGQVGLGTSSPSNKLDVGSGNIELGGGNNTALTWSADVSSHYLKFTSALNGLTLNGYGGLVFETFGANERMRIDSSGRLLVGTSSARTGWFNTTVSAPLIQSETTNINVVSGVQNSANSNGPWILLGKSRGSSVGAVTVVQNNDQIGSITFQGADGTQMVEGAKIQGFVDGTPGANDMPGRLVFSTTADGASSPTERFRISSSGTATFTGSVTAAGLVTVNEAVRSNRVAGSQACFSARLNGTENSVITADGTASFAGSVTIGKTTSGASDIGARFIKGSTTELLSLDCVNGGSSDVAYQINNNGSSTYQVFANGSATFAGSVGIGRTSPGEKLDILSTSGNCLIKMQAPVGSVSGFNAIGSNVLAFQTGFSEKARIDSSGRLLVGTSTSTHNIGNQSKLGVVITGDTSRGGVDITGYTGGSNTGRSPELNFRRSIGTTDGSLTAISAAPWSLGAINFSGSNGSNFSTAAQILAVSSGQAYTGSQSAGELRFSVTANGASSPTERMRIQNNGGTFLFQAGDGFRSHTNAGAGTTFILFAGRHSASSNLNGTTSFLVYSNGNVQNTNNSYGSISDVKLKENIVDANSQWADIKDLRVRNYNFIEGQTHTQIGVVAQEVETVSPGLVYETPDRDEEGTDLGTTTKSVNYSVLYMKAVKALQEAMERIETLETKVAALEAG